MLEPAFRNLPAAEAIPARVGDEVSAFPNVFIGARAEELRLKWEPGDDRLPLSDYVRTKMFPYRRVSEPSLQAAVDHLKLLLSETPKLSVRQKNGGMFHDADGESFNYPYRYIWFSSGGVDFGFVRLAYGVATKTEFGVIEGTPFCVILVAQGVKGLDSRKLPVHESALACIIKHVISSWRPLTENSWRVGMQFNEFTSRLAEPFFEHAPLLRVPAFIVTSDSFSSGRYSVMPLRQPKDNKAVRALLEPERIHERKKLSSSRQHL